MAFQTEVKMSSVQTLYCFKFAQNKFLKLVWKTVFLNFNWCKLDLENSFPGLKLDLEKPFSHGQDLELAWRVPANIDRIYGYVY